MKETPVEKWIHISISSHSFAISVLINGEEVLTDWTQPLPEMDYSEVFLTLGCAMEENVFTPKTTFIGMMNNVVIFNK